MDYGTGYLLYPSEMDAIEVIGRNPGINVTGLAKKLGVTKGAVSQSIKKLEKKHLIGRFEDSSDEKAVLLKLERQGEIAFDCHERFHAKYDSYIKDELNRMTAEQISFLEECFRKIEKSVDKYLDELT